MCGISFGRGSEDKSAFFISEFVCDPDHFLLSWFFVWKVISRTKSGVFISGVCLRSDYFIVPVIRLAGVIETPHPYSLSVILL
jgi:hypothetical protein